VQIGPITVSRGTLTPYVQESRTAQTRKIAGDGSVVVTDQPFAFEEFFRARIKVDRDEARVIKSFLEGAGAGFARNTFVLVDGFGVSYTVRFWDRRVRLTYIKADLVQMDLLFRREIAA